MMTEWRNDWFRDAWGSKRVMHTIGPLESCYCSQECHRWDKSDCWKESVVAYIALAV